MSSPLLIGFLASFTLIAAIGAQNAFVLRQGIRREHVLPVVAVCTVSDIVLISAGIAGFGALIGAHPSVVDIAKFGGAAFLIGYGLLAARRAWRPSALTPSESAPARLIQVVVTCLALTWLNPHVYLDTVVLLGALGQRAPRRPVAVRHRCRDRQRGLVRQPRTGGAPACRTVRDAVDLAHPRQPDRRHDDRTGRFPGDLVTYLAHGGH